MCCSRFERRNEIAQVVRNGCGSRAERVARSGPTAYNVTHASCVRLVRRETIPTLPASDWSVVRIYPRFLRLIGPSLFLVTRHEPQASPTVIRPRCNNTLMAPPSPTVFLLVRSLVPVNRQAGAGPVGLTCAPLKE